MGMDNGSRNNSAPIRDGRESKDRDRLFNSVRIMAWGVCCGLILCVLSLAQKMFIDAPISYRGFIVPTLFGFLAGAGLGIWRGRALRTMRELAERESYLSALLATMQAGVFIIDCQSRKILDCNDSAARIMGMARHEILGQNCRGFICDVQENACPILDLGLSLNNHEQSLFTQGGQARPVLKTACEQHLMGRKVLIETFMDLTERKRLEAQLLQAQKMEAMGTLAGGIAHDFNNILGAIIGYTELASLKVPKENEISQNLTQVLKAAERARALVSQILNFVRGGKAEVHGRAISMASIVKETLKLLRATLPAFIEIRTRIADAEGLVDIDADQVHQVIMNLCTNAVQAMDHKGVLEVELCEFEVCGEPGHTHIGLTPGLYQVLTVADNGAGMDQETMKRIFDPFFTTKGAGRGTGLGLSVVHGIVNNHGGAIEVYSEKGIGSKFMVYLPQSRRTTSDRAPVETVARIKGGRERILVVDDEPDILGVFSQSLSSWGYGVTCAQSGSSAVELFQKEPDGFDLAILDYVMPGDSGTEVAAKLLQIKPELPVLLSTGLGEAAVAEKARSIGAALILKKPFTALELCRSVRKVLDESSGKHFQL